MAVLIHSSINPPICNIRQTKPAEEYNRKVAY